MGNGNLCIGSMRILLWGERSLQEAADGLLPDSIVSCRKSGVCSGACGHPAVLSRLGMDGKAVSASLLFEGVLTKTSLQPNKMTVRDGNICQDTGRIICLGPPDPGGML